MSRRLHFVVSVGSLRAGCAALAGADRVAPEPVHMGGDGGGGGGGRRVWGVCKPFINGGIAGSIGIAIVQPMDLIKTRVQVAAGSQGILSTYFSILAHEGVRGLYAGMTAQLLRAWTYAPARFGVFLTLEETFSRNYESGVLPFAQKAGCGLAAGASAAVISNPAEVAIVRMQVDKSLPAAERCETVPVFHSQTRQRAFAKTGSEQT